MIDSRKYMLVCVLFSQSLHACEVVDVMTNNIGSSVTVVRDGINFSSREVGDVVSINEFSDAIKSSLARTQNKVAITDFSTYAMAMCEIIGKDCQAIDIASKQLLKTKEGNIQSLLLPVFVGGQLVGDIHFVKSAAPDMYKCDKPSDLHIKKSVEIFIKTGRKDNVVDYLRSINKVKPDGYGGWVATEQ